MGGNEQQTNRQYGGKQQVKNPYKNLNPLLLRYSLSSLGDHASPSEDNAFV